MVRIYWTDTAQLDMDKAYASCSEERRRKADGLKQEADRRRSLAAALMLDEALKSIGLREKDAQYSRTDTGKPEISGLQDVHFSLSHSGAIAVCAISDRPVGVDVEQPREISERLLCRYCTEAERSAAEPVRLWTLKEACCKMTGRGLLGLSDAVLIFGDAVKVDGVSAAFWETVLPNGYRLALCCGGNDPIQPEIYEKTGAI